MAHVVEQVGHFHEQGLSAQVNAIVADGRREMSLSAERTAQQHEPAFGFLRERDGRSDGFPQRLEILLRHLDARDLLVLDLVAEAILLLGGGRHRFGHFGRSIWLYTFSALPLIVIAEMAYLSYEY